MWNWYIQIFARFLSAEWCTLLLKIACVRNQRKSWPTTHANFRQGFGACVTSTSRHTHKKRIKWTSSSIMWTRIRDVDARNSLSATRLTRWWRRRRCWQICKWTKQNYKPNQGKYLRIFILLVFIPLSQISNYIHEAFSFTYSAHSTASQQEREKKIK